MVSQVRRQCHLARLPVTDQSQNGKDFNKQQIYEESAFVFLQKVPENCLIEETITTKNHLFQNIYHAD